MKQYILSYDCETTGLSTKDDYIIQLAAVKFDSQTFEVVESKSWYVKPIHNYIIDPSAEETHHLTKEFIDANGLPMREVGKEFIQMAEGCDLLSYNGNRFDIKMLTKDLELAGLHFDLTGRKFYDSYGMECRFNPRDLGSTYRKYMGKDFEDAHDALADVKATIAVFQKQIETQKLTAAEIDEYQENNLLSPEGSIRKSNLGDKEDHIVFAVGKYKDTEFMKVCEQDPSYIKWFMNSVASSYTKDILREYYKKKKMQTK